jgi:tRNA A-37 threonylcarbamoyl transferase component Bud32
VNTNCLGESQVIDLLNGAASSGASLSHIDGCDECRQVLSAMATGALRPAMLGRYVIGETIGAGASGVVYRAFDPLLDRDVAVKLLYRSALAWDHARLEAALRREAQAMARVRHPNVVTVHDVGWHDGRAYVAMALIDGGALRRHLGPLPWRRALEIFSRAGEGLHAVHRAGLLHRDFKPENVMLDKDGGVFLTDLGLARGLGAGSDGAVGTPLYMAPEQLRGAALDARADLYSFSATFYEALAGERPFAGESVAALAAAIRRGPASLPKRAAPRWLAAAIVRGLAYDKNQRPPDMAALLAALRPKPKRWPVAIAAAAALVGITAFMHAPKCDGGAEALRPIWNSTREKSVSAAFTALTGNNTAAPLAVARLRTFAERFALTDRQICEASAVGRQSSELLDQRMQCLATDLAGFAAGLSLIENATPDPMSLVATLPDPRDCATAPPRLPLPAEPDLRKKIGEAEARVAEADAATEAGRPQDAQAALEKLRGEIAELSYPPLSAKEKYEWGKAVSLKDPPATWDALREAGRQAEVGRDDRVRLQALLQRIVIASYWGKFDDAEALAADASALLARLGTPADLAVQLEVARSKIDQCRNAMLAAEAHMARAMALERARPESSSLTQLSLEAQMCVMQAGAGHPQTAMHTCEAAERGIAAAYGPWHTRLSVVYSGWGIAASALGQYAFALSVNDKQLAINERHYGAHNPMLASALMSRSTALAGLHRHREAIAALDRAEALFPKGSDALELKEVAEAKRALTTQ